MKIIIEFKYKKKSILLLFKSPIYRTIKIPCHKNCENYIIYIFNIISIIFIMHISDHCVFMCAIDYFFY